MTLILNCHVNDGIGLESVHGQGITAVAGEDDGLFPSAETPRRVHHELS